MLLDGMKILDLSRLLPGPLASMILADMGAEVLKIEDTGAGDYMRLLGPKGKNQQAYYDMVNRNKKSMTLNLKEEEGKGILKKLIEEYDILIEGFRPGVMNKLGLGYDELKKINPKLIYCAITGYGQEGVRRNKAGHDINYLALSGVLGTIGQKGKSPALPGIQIADIGGGAMPAVISILAAFIQREKAGEGSFIDVAMCDCSTMFLPLVLGQYFATDKDFERGNELLTGKFACYNVYRTKDDKFVSLGALEEKFWKKFCLAVEREDLIDLQFNVEHQESLKKTVGEIIAAKTREEWSSSFEDVDCCLEPVKDVSEAVSDKDFVEKGLMVPDNEVCERLSFPVKFSNFATKLNLRPPKQGEHTLEILSSLGYTEEDVDKLKEEAIV